MGGRVRWHGGARTGCVVGGDAIATNDIGSSWARVAVVFVARGRVY